MKKIMNFLGLMQRAGKLVFGEDLIIQNIRNKKIKLLIISENCGKNTSKKLIDKANFYNVEYIRSFKTEDISNAVGKNNRVAIGITDSGFSKKILEMIKEEE